MSHQDTDRLTVSAPHHQALKNVLDWLLKSARLSDLVFREECTWTPKGLIFAAILWSWSDEKTLVDRFSLARKVVTAMAILSQRPAKSYQAFLQRAIRANRAAFFTLRRDQPFACPSDRMPELT